MTDKPKPATPPPRSKGFTHPHPTHDDDLVAVKVIHAKGVNYQGKTYRQGQAFVMRRSAAMARDDQGRRPLRILKTVRYVNDPADQAEDGLEEGPLDLG